MLKISEWKKRPRKFSLRFDEKMAEVIIDGKTKHLKLGRDDEIVGMPADSANFAKSVVEEKVETFNWKDK